MASIVKRGKAYAVVYYEGEGKNKHQVWESGLSYNAAKSRKAQLEYEVSQNIHIEQNDMTVSEFLHEFVQKYGEKRWVASTYDGNVGLLENYVYPYLGDKKLRSIRTKTVDDYYHFLLFEAEPVTNPGKPKREHLTTSIIHDIHKVLRCAFNQAVKWEYIAKNPFLNATLPEHKEKKRAALTPEQLQKVMEFTDRPDIYDYYLIHCAIHLAFACSMRGGEVGGARRRRGGEIGKLRIPSVGVGHDLHSDAGTAQRFRAGGEHLSCDRPGGRNHRNCADMWRKEGNHFRSGVPSVLFWCANRTHFRDRVR